MTYAGLEYRNSTSSQLPLTEPIVAAAVRDSVMGGGVADVGARHPESDRTRK